MGSSMAGTKLQEQVFWWIIILHCLNLWQPLMETWRDIKENPFPKRQLNHLVTGSARKLPAVGQYYIHQIQWTVRQHELGSPANKSRGWRWGFKKGTTVSITVFVDIDIGGNYLFSSHLLVSTHVLKIRPNTHPLRSLVNSFRGDAFLQKGQK